jgi:electron transfer flavoprotein alpha subunit
VNSSLARDPASRACIWVIDRSAAQGTYERLGDARLVADALGERVGVIVVEGDAEKLIAQGADLVVRVLPAEVGPAAFGSAVSGILHDQWVRLVYVSHSPEGRALAARWAVRTAATLVSPGLLVRRQGTDLVITGLDDCGRRARTIVVPPERSAVVALRDGVGQALPADAERRGTVVTLTAAVQPEPVIVRRLVPLDPATADIRRVRRLVAGGRGVGGAQGFDQLRRVARLLEAGVAASRVAVDLGWIEYDRQVGQTGKTVGPDLYLACGISGAAHHLEGMSGSRHIVAINTDPQAPLFAHAHLGLVADLVETLKHLEQALTDARRE